MCQSIFLTEGVRTLKTIGDLRKVVGLKDLVFAASYEVSPTRRPSDLSCLCPVNIPATARKAGYRCSRDPFDSMGFKWSRNQ